MKKLLIIQPYLTKYRLPLFHRMASSYSVGIAFSKHEKSTGFGEVSAKNFAQEYILQEKKLLGGIFLIQNGIVSTILNFKPDKIIISANPRNISYWIVLLLSIVLRYDVYSHGQGLYRKNNPKLLAILFWIITLASKKYIAYSDISKQKMIKIFVNKKIKVVSNSLIFEEKIEFIEKNNKCKDILFVGRLRDGSRIDDLISAVDRLRLVTGIDVNLKIVGGGGDFNILKKKFCGVKWIKWYGEIYDFNKIKEISESCFSGCYPGDAGLSVVQYMALSIFPVVHGSWSEHMGPEPSYVIDGVNGLVFSRNNSVDDICNKYASIINNDDAINFLRKGALSTYLSLSLMAEKFLEELND